MQSSRTFTHQEKKQIAVQIEKLRNKKHFKHIFKLIYEDNNRYTLNDNGVYVNINALPDTTLAKIKEYLDEVERSKSIIPVPKEYVPYCSEDAQSSDIKLSTQERNLLKKLRGDTKKHWQHATDSDMINTITTTEKPEEGGNKPRIEIKPFSSFMND